MNGDIMRLTGVLVGELLGFGLVVVGEVGEVVGGCLGFYVIFVYYTNGGEGYRTEFAVLPFHGTLHLLGGWHEAFGPA